VIRIGCKHFMMVGALENPAANEHDAVGGV
jgi:hypothetical protein